MRTVRMGDPCHIVCLDDLGFAQELSKSQGNMESNLKKCVQEYAVKRGEQAQGKSLRDLAKLANIPLER